MAGIFIAFTIGIIISGTGKVPEKMYRNIDRILTVILVFLLFGMGLNIGLDKDILQNILSLGKVAFFISFSAVLGSVVFAWIFGKMIFGERR